MKTKSNTITPTRVADAIRYAPNPLPQLTPANLAAYLDSFARGYLRDTALLWNQIQWRDDRVAADSGKRHKAIARYGYAVEPADGAVSQSSKRAVQRHVDAITYCLENLTARDVLDGSVRGGISMLCRQMMRAAGMQYQVHELVWRKAADGVTVDATAMPLWWFERTVGRLRFLEQDLAIEGVDLEPDGWLVTRGDGLMAPTCVLYLLKRMSLTDWALYNGRVGPGIHGKTTAAKDSDEWRALEDAVESFDFDLKIVTGDGVTITPIECGLKGTLPWPQMYDAMTKAITILWRGGNLMTDSAGSAGGGEQKGVGLQGAESLLIEQDDSEMISDAINDYIVAPLIRFRFNEEPLAWVAWKTAPRTDLSSDRATDEFLAGRGFPFSLEDLAERYGRSLPAEGDTLAVPPAPSALPPVSAANAFDPSQPRDDQGQWTTSEGFTAVPMGKKMALGDEVVWKDETGQERHGQLSFHEERTIRNGTEIRSERTGRTHVHEVRVEQIPHPTIPGAKARKLVPIGANPNETTLVDTTRLRKLKGGYMARARNNAGDNLDEALTSITTAAVDQTLAVRADLTRPWLARLEALANRTDLDESQFLDAVEALIRELPADMLTPAGLSALAKPLEGLLGASVVNALSVDPAAERGRNDPTA